MTFDRASNRAFGFVFAGLFFILAILRFWKQQSGAPILAAIAVAFLSAAVWSPNLLKPLNRIWMKFGEVIHRIVSPVILGIIFYLVITPIGLLKRLVGSDSMHRTFDKSRTSYWVVRDPKGPKPETMRHQF